MKRYHTNRAREISPDYHEIPYTDYLEDGSIKEQGTEDFSGTRLRGLTRRSAYIRTGHKRQDDSDSWEQIDCITANSTRDCLTIARLLHGDGVKMRMY